MIEYGGFDIDVAALHQAFLRGARAEAATVLREHGVRALAHRDGSWRVDTGERALSCATVVTLVRRFGLWLAPGVPHGRLRRLKGLSWMWLGAT